MTDEGGELYTVIKDFHARLGDELSINRGDTVELISDDSEYSDGWFMGKNLSTGKVGLYPKLFTKPKADQSGANPALLRSRSRRLTPQGNTARSSPNNTAVSTNSLGNVPETPAAQQTHAMPPTGTPDNSVSNANRSTPTSTQDTATLITPESRRSRGSNSSAVYSSVHRTMEDIDKALSELQDDSTKTTNLDPSQVKSWTPEQVTEWFSSLNYDMSVAGQFARHKISGDILLQMELVHLKELDITSFGTRFELYKEIEELRLAAKRGGQLQSPYVANSQFIGSPRMPQQEQRGPFNRGHARKRSQSLDELATPVQSPESTTSPALSQRPVSVMQPPTTLATNNSNNSNNSSDDETSTKFASPRQAPKPPSVSSPIADRLFASQNDTSDLKVATSDESRKDEPANDQPKYQERISETLSHSRGPSLGQTSSVYEPASRTTSFSYAPSHQRNVSDVSQLKSDSVAPLSVHRKSSSTDGRPKSRLPNAPALQIQTQQQQQQQQRSQQRSPSQPAQASPQVGQLPSPNRRAFSNNETSSTSPKVRDSGKRMFSATAALRSFTGHRTAKSQTSAFQEGIREITPAEAAKQADFSGWMFKRGNLSIGTWKQRFFTLNKTRLSYFASSQDTREKGLIDVTAHRVVAATEAEDKLSAVYAASAGFGRYCFKLVPPAPGSRKGLTFTQQKVHYFAVETSEEMRDWMAAFMRATIELDDTVPVISSCVTPTIPLQRAQELLQEARANAKTNMETIQRLKDEADKDRNASADASSFDTQSHNTSTEQDSSADTTKVSTSFNTGSASNTGSMTTTPTTATAPHMDNSNNKATSPANGMSTPYLMTSGMSPNSSSDLRKPSKRNPPPVVTKIDYPASNTSQPSTPVDTESRSSSSSTPIMSAVGAMGRKVMSLRKSKE